MKIFCDSGSFEKPSRRAARAGFWLASALLLAGCVQSTSSTGAAPVGPNTLNVADAAIASGDPDMALSVSQSVLATDAGNVDALEHEGDAYYALDRCPAAEAAYRLALTHDARATAAQTGLGRCLLKTDLHAAELAFAQAVQDDPGNADALNDLGIARDLQGNFAGAVAPYQQALMANPALTAAEVNLGLSLALSGNGPEALQYLGPLATSQTATPKIREDYAAALVASGREDEARQVLSVDLPPDQVVSALAGFSAVIAQSQAAPPPLPLPAPTVTAVPAAAVSAAPIAAAANPVPLVPAGMPAAASANVQDRSAAVPVPVAAAMSGAAPGANGEAASVQLGALSSPGDAERAWRDDAAAYPALFGGKEPEILPATVDGKIFYRLRIGGFGSKADAAKFCGQISASGSACTLADF